MGLIYPRRRGHRTLTRMVQPALRIFTAEQAADAARSLETPSEVRQFVALASESSSVRAFIQAPEWAAINRRIMGDGKPPSGALESLAELARFCRWTSDGSLGERPDPSAAAAYRHMAVEIEAFDRRMRRAVPVSPAVTANPKPPSTAPAAGLSFASALAAVKAGQHATRSSWRGGYVTAQAAYPQGIGVNANTARATGLPEGATAVFRPYLMRALPQVTPVVDDGRFVEPTPAFVPWTPDQDDLFAEDWRILPRG
jgi:hypothetical protein